MSKFETSDEVKKAIEQLNEEAGKAAAERENFYRSGTPKINGKEIPIEEWKKQIAEGYIKKEGPGIYKSFDALAKQANDKGVVEIPRGNKVDRVHVKTQADLTMIQKTYVDIFTKRARAEGNFYKIGTDLQEAAAKGQKLSDEEAKNSLRKIPDLIKAAQTAQLDPPSALFNILTLEKGILANKKTQSPDDKERLEAIDKKREILKNHLEKRSKPSPEKKEPEPDGVRNAEIPKIPMNIIAPEGVKRAEAETLSPEIAVALLENEISKDSSTGIPTLPFKPSSPSRKGSRTAA